MLIRIQCHVIAMWWSCDWFELPSQDHDAGDGYDCACDPGYTGTDCGIDINECDPDPCRNGATCSVRFHSIMCLTKIYVVSLSHYIEPCEWIQLLLSARLPWHSLWNQQRWVCCVSLCPWHLYCESITGCIFLWWRTAVCIHMLVPTFLPSYNDYAG